MPNRIWKKLTAGITGVPTDAAEKLEDSDVLQRLGADFALGFIDQLKASGLMTPGGAIKIQILIGGK